MLQPKKNSKKSMKHTKYWEMHKKRKIMINSDLLILVDLDEEMREEIHLDEDLVVEATLVLTLILEIYFHNLAEENLHNLADSILTLEIYLVDDPENNPNQKHNKKHQKKKISMSPK